MSMCIALAVLIALQTPRASAATEKVVVNCTGDGSGNNCGNPSIGNSMIVSADGTILVGTVEYGGTDGNGVVFSLNSSGTFTQLDYAFSLGGAGNGYLPQSPLVEDSSGNYYGTLGRADNGAGDVLYELSAGTWAFTPLVQGLDDPQGPLVLQPCSNGDSCIYGTDNTGGTYGYGVLWEYDLTTLPSSVTVLHDFAGTDGSGPSGLVYYQMAYQRCIGGPDVCIQLTTDALFGTTSSGGSSSDGVLYEYTLPGGSFSVLHNFSGNPDGNSPYNVPFQYSLSTLYGTTASGGSKGNGTIYSYVFGTSTESVVYSFGTNSGDGNEPLSALTEDSSGNLYGTTLFGGAHSDGTVFELSSGTESLLYSFKGGTSDGCNPYANVTIFNSDFYTMTYGCGADGAGTIVDIN